VYLKMKNFAAAIADYDAVLQANPKSASSLYGRGLAKRIEGGGDADMSAAERIDPNIRASFTKYDVPSP